jgi:hypothetical protein
MTLFYHKRVLVTLPELAAKIQLILANCHLRDSQTQRTAGFWLRNATDDVISGGTQRREVLCITMGLCIVGRYKNRFRHVTLRVVRRDA